MKRRCAKTSSTSLLLLSLLPLCGCLLARWGRSCGAPHTQTAVYLEEETKQTLENNLSLKPTMRMLLLQKKETVLLINQKRAVQTELSTNVFRQSAHLHFLSCLYLHNHRLICLCTESELVLSSKADNKLFTRKVAQCHFY